MSEERLERIEEKVDRLAARQEELVSDVAGLKTDVGGLKTDVAGLKTDVTGLKTDVAGLDRRLSKVEITQQDMRDRIQQVAEGHAATQAMITRGFAALHAHIDRRIDPLERAMREYFGTLPS